MFSNIIPKPSMSQQCTLQQNNCLNLTYVASFHHFCLKWSKIGQILYDKGVHSLCPTLYILLPSWDVQQPNWPYYALLQGVVVAILFCLINNEVIMEVKKFFGQHMDSGLNGPQSMAMTQYTVLVIAMFTYHALTDHFWLHFP